MRFQLSVITDEVSQDLETAVSFAREFGLSAVELRSVYERGPFAYTREDLGKIKALVKAAGLTVCCISAPFFKCDLEDKGEIERHIEGLKYCMEYSHDLGCGLIRGFSFWAKGPLEGKEEAIAEQFQRPIELLKDAGMRLALEFDPSVYACNSEKLARLLSIIDSPQVAALWDPGNELYAPVPLQPYPYGYELLKSRIAHIHLKDAVRDGKETISAAMCRGQVDYEGQFRALAEDGYEGYLSLETHHRLQKSISEELLQLPGGSEFSDGGLEASRESMQYLLELLGRVEA